MKALNSAVKYFDLVSSVRPTVKEDKAEGEKLPPVLPQYIALILGVLIQPFFAKFQETGEWSLEGITARILFAVIAGIIILPGVYKNSFDPKKPIFIQLCTLFVSGMGWESLLGTALKVVNPG